jgi:WD40 repeat protein
MRLHRILRKGTEKSFSNIAFSTSGQQFASVGSYPDYLLCVWDWKQECIQLKTKAFSQEVYRVCFSQYDEFTLTTSGTGHIRFSLFI